MAIFLLLAWLITSVFKSETAAVVHPSGSGEKKLVVEKAITIVPPPSRTDVEGQPALRPPLASELATSDRPPIADLLGASGTKPEDEPGILLDILNTYRRSIGAYPPGEDNRQITNALLGANSQRLPFIPFDQPRLNRGGEIVDAWGSPFFFHQISRDSIEIRSAGADRVLFTKDDLTAGSSP